jgi:hypothetical protein
MKQLADSTIDAVSVIGAGQKVGSVGQVAEKG